MIKNIIFDLGNVLVDFLPKEHFNTLTTNQELVDILSNLIFTNDAWSNYDMGLYSLDDVKKEYIALYPNYQDEINYLLDHWLEGLKLISVMYNKLVELKGKYHIYILSNLSKDAYDYINDQYELFTHIDGGVFSYECHINKPDERIYELLLKKYDLISEDCLFIDDSLANIKAANKLGLKTIHCIDIDKTIIELEEIIKC